LTLKSDPQLPSQDFKAAIEYRVLFSQSNLKVSTDLGYCKVFNPFYNLNCSAGERAAKQGYRKEQLFHTKHRSGRDRESNPEPPAWQAASLEARPSTTPIEPA
jgi:hypothetical protein